MSARVRLFVLVAVASLIACTVALASAVNNSGPSEASGAATTALASAREAGRATVLFRSRGDHTRDQVAIAPAAGSGSATLSIMRCERVYFRAGSGICVARGGGFAAGYQARIFGTDLRVRHQLTLAGIPSRARVSPNGRIGAVTMFVTGHAYATAGRFSTQTTLIDMRSGQKIADLEQFTSSRGGRVVTAADVNYWGVTFDPHDADRFYATLATGGHTYLVRGSISERSMRTLQENVECPSISPDGTRIAYKKRVGSGSRPWRLTVLDLRTMQETPLNGTEGIDDQAEWLDADHVLYGMGGQIHVVPADGSRLPTVFRADGDSPALVRW